MQSIESDGLPQSLNPYEISSYYIKTLTGLNENVNSGNVSLIHDTKGKNESDKKEIS